MATVQIVAQLIWGVKVQPRLMFEAVISDFTTVFRKTGDEFRAVCGRRIETHHIDRRGDPVTIEQFDHPAGQHAQVAGATHPIRIAVSALVTPVVIGIQGNRCNAFAGHSIPFFQPVTAASA